MLLYIMHAIYMCPNDYMLHACSAPSNLKTMSCVDTMLARTLGSAKLTTEADGNSKDLYDDGKGQGWTIQSSLKYPTSVRLSLTNVVMFMENYSMTKAS